MKLKLKKWAKRLAICCLILICGLAIGVWFGLEKVNESDHQHATFQSNGQSIKDMLSAYGNAFKEAHKKNNLESIESFYDDRFLAINRGLLEFRPQHGFLDVNISQFVSSGNQSLNREDVFKQISAYLGSIQEIDFAKFKIDLIEDLVPNERATLTVKYVLDGIDKDDAKIADRFFYRWKLNNQADSSAAPEWKIVDEELVSGERTSGKANAFERLSLKDRGIDYCHRRDPLLDKTALDSMLKFSVIEHAGGGLSAADYDRDGKPDLFFLDGVESKLYRNVTNQIPSSSNHDNQPEFKDVTDEVGLAGIGNAHSAIFADFDNDGDADLFVARYQQASRFYRNEKGFFHDDSATVGLNFVEPAVSTCLIDFDQDGFLDIYIGVNGNAHENAPNIPFYATNAEPNLLLRNVNGKSFEDVSIEAGIQSTGWTLACTSGDYNADGWPDILVANDFGRKVLYENNGDGTFRDVAKDAGVLDFSGGMGVSFTDLNGDLFPDILTSNIDSGVRFYAEETTLWQYMRNSIRTKWIFEDFKHYNELYGLIGADWKGLGKQIGEGNSVFLNNGGGKFTEWKDCNANRAGWAWSVNAFDYNNDSEIDIAVSNGWITSELEDDL